MRIAVLIIGLLVGLLLFLQSWSVGIFGEYADESGTTENAGGAGLVMALGWLLACALVLPFPLASTVIFALTIPIGLLTPTGEFSDLRFHGSVAVVLTTMSFFAWRGKRRADGERRQERERQEARDQRLEALLIQQHKAVSSAPSTAIPCPDCGHVSGPSARFCEACGARIMRMVGTNLAPELDSVQKADPVARTSTDWFDSIKQQSP